MSYSLEFMELFCTGSDGVTLRTVVGVDSDGMLWFEPKEIGVVPDDAPILARYRGGSCLMFHFPSQRVYVNAMAVLELQTDPEMRQRWLANVERTLQQFKQMKQQYDTPRNH